MGLTAKQFAKGQRSYVRHSIQGGSGQARSRRPIAGR